MNPEDQAKTKIKKMIKKRRKKSSSRSKNQTGSDSSIEPKTSESIVEEPPLKFFDAQSSVPKESADKQTSAMSHLNSATISTNQTSSGPVKETVTKKPNIPDL